jgi:hypothetical protein
MALTSEPVGTSNNAFYMLSNSNSNNSNTSVNLNTTMILNQNADNDNVRRAFRNMYTVRQTLSKLEVFHEAIVAHGTTYVEDMPEYSFYMRDLLFKCPPKIHIVLFEQPGKAFYKYESAYMYNYIQNVIRINDENIMKLDNNVIYIPFKNARNYYCRVFKPNENVPNIAFEFSEDPDIQLGIYSMKKNIFEEKGYTPFVKFNTTDYNVKYPAEFIDIGVSTTVGLEPALQDGGKIIYRASKTSLKKIVDDISKRLIDEPQFYGRGCILYVISCRVFQSQTIALANTSFGEFAENYIAYAKEVSAKINKSNRSQFLKKMEDIYAKAYTSQELYNRGYNSLTSALMNFNYDEFLRDRAAIQLFNSGLELRNLMLGNTDEEAQSIVQSLMDNNYITIPLRFPSGYVYIPSRNEASGGYMRRSTRVRRGRTRGRGRGRARTARRGRTRRSKRLRTAH